MYTQSSTVSKGQGGIAIDVDKRGEHGHVLSMFKTYVMRSWDWPSAVNTDCYPCVNRVHAETAQETRSLSSIVTEQLL